MGPEEVIDTINPIPAMAGQDLSKDEISDKQSVRSSIPPFDKHR